MVSLRYKNKTFATKIISTLAITALLSACGGSSGGSDSGSDDSGNGDTGVITNTAPVANAGSDQNITSPATVTVSGALSSDADNDNLSYSWSLTATPSGSSATLTAATAEQTNFTADIPGSYQLTLTVNDGTDSASDQLVVVASNAASSSMTLTSAAFKNTGSSYYNLPLTYTCDGVNGGTSPLLSWSGVPDSATHLAITMHTINTDNSSSPQFSLFNISSTTTTLPSGDFSSGTAATGDMTVEEIASAGMPYAAPCTAGAGVETLYIFTLYALSEPLSLTADTNQTELTSTINDILLDSTTLTTRRVHYDASAIAADLHVPKSVPSTCLEKTAHFNEYSSIHQSISCDDDSNQLDVISYVSDGLKTLQSNQQIQVGITSWIGRLSLPSPAGASMKVSPTFLAGVNNNASCDGTGALGVTIDGQLILPYYKQSNNAGTGDSCGPTDGENYANRDTVVLGEVDQCYGHSPNGEGYHMHGAPVCLMDVHDPSKPIAYMTDGIPMYFGQGGGTIEDTLHAQTASAVTDTNFGAGLYEHLDYRPSDVKDGSNPLNACNAYDINGDGAVSGYVYYSTKDAPYTIGCFMGEALDADSAIRAENTKLVSDRSGWTGQSVGEALNVEVTANYSSSFNGKNYNITEILVNENTSFLTQGDTAQVLWRTLDSDDTGYDASTTCFEFRYRSNKNTTDNDEIEIVCSERTIADETLNFSPFDSDDSGSSDDSSGDNDNSLVSFKLEAWADNWFAAYLGDELIVEDSVAITTERSFNAETATFTGSYPLYLNVILKDYKENDTGLEYIGEGNQQMGDGGFIAQITNTGTSEIIAVSNSDWKCSVIHEAPLDTSCANESNPVAGVAPCEFTSSDEPSNWKSSDYDDSAWSNATEHTVADVSPKDGYDEISWDANAQLIWGPDLETNNTLLCRVTVTAP